MIPVGVDLAKCCPSGMHQSKPLKDSSIKLKTACTSQLLGSLANEVTTI